MIVVFWAICGVVAGLVAGPQRTMGFWLGILFGPIGIIVAAIIGNRPPPQTVYASPPPPAITVKPPPLKMTIRRKGKILGEYSYADVIDYLQTGTLHPTDMYLADPAKGTWSMLKFLP